MTRLFRIAHVSRIVISRPLPVRLALASMLVAVALLSGCRDTCNDGETFRDLRLLGGIEVLDGQDVVRIGWSPGSGRGDDLPEGYFAAVEVQGADSAMLTGENEITVVLDSLEQPVPSSTMSFSLVFPDRRDHIECVHPGAPDTYYILVDLHFGPSGELTHADLIEDFRPGPI